jgi:hypothetical protein
MISRMSRLVALLGAVLTPLLMAPACGSSKDSPKNVDLDGGSAFVDGSHTKPPPASCQAASESKSYIGCDYWPTVVANNVWDIFDYAVVVANGQAVDAQVTVSGGAGGGHSEIVRAGSLTKIFLPWVPELKGPQYDACTNSTPLPGSVLAHGGAYHLVSSVPVTVYQFNALEYKGTGGPALKDWSACPGNAVCSQTGIAPGCFAFSNDASLLLPSTAWTGNYRVTGQKGLGNETQGVGSYFAVVAATNGTNVTVKLPALQATLPGAGINGTSTTLSFALAAGDVAEITAPAGTNHDLSGALVQADHPVEVIAGTPCSIGGTPQAGATCDPHRGIRLSRRDPRPPLSGRPTDEPGWGRSTGTSCGFTETPTTPP